MILKLKLARTVTLLAIPLRGCLSVDGQGKLIRSTRLEKP